MDYAKCNYAKLTLIHPNTKKNVKIDRMSVLKIITADCIQINHIEKLKFLQFFESKINNFLLSFTKKSSLEFKTSYTYLIE